jgi:hypothetical protein
MFFLKNSLLGLGAGLLLAGAVAQSMAAAPASQLVGCDGCKLVKVQVTDTNSKGRPIGYHQVEKMICPSCKDAVQTFISTGKFAHSCSTCGSNMAACEAHAN